jgi:SAM-dependent methyltransferase
MKNKVPENFNPKIKHPLYLIRNGLFKKVSKYASELHGSILDFGCGEKPYESLFCNATKYIGLDYSSEGHDHSNEKIDVFYDGKTIPFNDNTFDNIFSSEVFEHVFELESILPELNRILKKNGKILITFPFAWEEHEIPIDYARYTIFSMRYLLEKNGMKILSIDKNGHVISALHQIFINYFNNIWIHNIPLLSKFNLFKKIARQLIIPCLNIIFIIMEPLWPKSDKFYLNSIILAQKI